ncbi:NUDIX hydrolase [Streptomyces profundus]|uniref:NUDIX hydrolase n=1 Tax=Streptomyces profundus TaxID=2867410 RepID=UPI001D1647F2|nr:NUDIX domain-containing protein [Streptomyces sp. MA3_2.13]UED82907.1 NUDIX domain-containing protein [Streptomyces sp. MA3_2.13]
MATPDFIRALRTSIGHQLLFLPGVTAVVFDDEGRVLLVRRADDGRWTLVGGIPEPGEQPAETAVREVFEETAIRCAVERVLLVETGDVVRYPNEDECQFTDISFHCRALGGTARPHDDESVEVGWFPLDALPPLSEHALHRIELATADRPTWFAPAEPPTAG